MLVDVIEQLDKGTYLLNPQDKSSDYYYPLRFPEDGLILWDLCNAETVHNYIRALTEPYPCAFTYFNGQKVKLISSTLANRSFVLSS